MEPVLLAAAAVLPAAVLAGLALRRWLLFVTKVDSVSMAPTLLPGRRVLTWRLKHPGRIRRGDILVVMSGELGRVVVKRVLGLPGEQVVIGDTGHIRVDGVPVPEPYVVHPGGPSGTFQVPPGHLLLLGDNRLCSHDSRRWQRPYVPLTAVRGKVITGSGSGSARFLKSFHGDTTAIRAPRRAGRYLAGVVGRLPGPQRRT